MATTCVESLLLGSTHSHICSSACNTAVRLESRIRNALQSLSNCAFLVARDQGVSPEHIPLLTQMQTEIATIGLLLRRMKAASSPKLGLNSLLTQKGDQ